MSRHRWWSLAILGGLAGLAGLLAITSDTRGQMLVGFGVIALIAATWLAVTWLEAKTTRVGSERVGAIFMAALTIGTFALCFISPDMAFIQLFAYPYAWQWSRRDDRATASNIAIALAVGFGTALGLGGDARAWLSGALSGGLSVAFSFAMGYWVVSIARSAEAQGRLQAELDVAHQDLEEAGRVIGAATERERFARELHDTITQTLTGLALLTDRARDELSTDPASAALTLELVGRSTRQAIDETRALIARGTAPAVEDDGLAAAIQRVAGQLGEETGIAVTVSFGAVSVEESGGDARSVALPAIDRPTEVVLLRCTQELLANVRRHSRARQVRVDLAVGQATATLTVSDDGCGFDPQSPTAGFGLRGIGQRLALTGGTMSIARSEPSGATVTVSVPLRDAALVPPAQADAEGSNP